MNDINKANPRLASISYQSLLGTGSWQHCMQEVGAQLSPYIQYLRTAIKAAEAIRPKLAWREATRAEAATFEERRNQRLDQAAARNKARHSGHETKPRSGDWIVLEECADSADDHDELVDQFLEAEEIFDLERCPKDAVIEPIDSDYEGEALLVPRLPQPIPKDLPEGGEASTLRLIWLRIDTYGLSRQSQAVRNLENSPLDRHAPLVRLMTTQPTWSHVWNTSLSENEWVFLRPANTGVAMRDGTAEQRRFVEVALATPDYAILEGPPGSGKTTAICELIVQLARQNKRVLLVASTHVAVDNVLERLLEQQQSSRRADQLVLPVRIGDEKRVTSDVVLPWRYQRLLATWNKQLRQFLSRPSPHDPRASAARQMLLDSLGQSDGYESAGVANLLIESSNLVCGTTIGILQHPAIKGARDTGITCEPFDVMILDEASKTTFAEFLVPALHARKWIVVGDIRQLSPYVEEQYLEDNVRGLLPPSQAAAACHAFHAGRATRLVTADDTLRPWLRQECEARQIACADLDALLPKASQELRELLFADLVFGKVESIHALQHRLPLDLQPAELSDPPSDWAAARAAMLAGRPARSPRCEEEDWAKAVAWRLIRSYELRQNPAESKKLDRDIDALIPRTLGPEWFKQRKTSAQRRDGKDKSAAEELRRDMDGIRRCAMPSILELLQSGFARISDRHDGVALTDGLPAWVLDQRLVSLSYQHRMHPDIAAFPREQFYSQPGRASTMLRDSTGLERSWSYHRYSRRAEWLEVRPKRGGRNSRNENPAEADQLIEELRAFVAWASSSPRPDGKPWEVAVLTFYRAQEALLRDRLRDISGARGNARTFQLPRTKPAVHITLCTVDRFQGHEADLVLLSFVKSGTVGFLNSPNRLNVALTRARYQLVLIGDRTFFKDCHSDLLKSVANSAHYPAAIAFHHAK